jgi:hypothetical protein
MTDLKKFHSLPDDDPVFRAAHIPAAVEAALVKLEDGIAKCCAEVRASTADTIAKLDAWANGIRKREAERNTAYRTRRK